jgi:hypothetical protein
MGALKHRRRKPPDEGHGRPEKKGNIKHGEERRG